MEDKLRADLRQAQLSRDEIRISTLRLILSALNYEKIKKGELEQEDVHAVLRHEAKKRREAIESFKAGGREELAQKEAKELSIIEGYLPEELSNEELTKIVEEVIKELGAQKIEDMGRVIGKVLGKVAGRAGGGRVSAIVRDILKIP